MDKAILQSLLQQTAEFLDDAIIIVNKNREIVWANLGANQVFGYEQNELLGLNIQKLLPERVRDTHAKKIVGFQSDSIVFKSMREPKGKALRKNGEEFSFEASLMRVKHNTDEYYAVMLRDITFKYQLQYERQQLQVQLEHAYKLQLLGQFTSGIAHDFNNILATIMGYSGLVERFVLNMDGTEKIKDYINEVTNAAKRGRDLVAQMLAFARNKANTFEKGGVVQLAKQTLKMIHPVIPSSIELKTDFPEEEIDIKMDAIKIGQVIMNLCINARDATKGKGTIDFSIKKMQLEDAFCAACGEKFSGEFNALIVKDNGAGIKAEQLKNLFDPFYTTKQAEGGTGLGLSMVKSIVHEHHGHIMIQSQVGVGSEFCILLPNEGSAMSDQANEVIDSDNKEKYLLVVDDEVSVTRFLKELFQSEGYSVIATNDSRTALKEFLSHPNRYSMVITDQTMPGLTGIEMVREIRKNMAHVPIILCTGYSEQVDEAYAKKEGVDEFLAKPVDPFKLRDLVNSMVKGNSVH